jgi:hypothetical protein
MPGRNNLPHLRVDGFRTTHPFATPQSGRGKFNIASRVRREHGRNLLRQLGELSPKAQQRIEQQHRLSAEIPAGVYIQFESEPGFELASDSLASEASGIELLAVVERGRRFFATVFVPEGKLPFFEQRVRDYLEKDSESKNGTKPRNQKLINNIAQIRLATLRGLWTDDPSLYPADLDTPMWWEVWLRVGETRERFITLFREHGSRLGLEIGARDLRFLERTVIAARGSGRVLAQSVGLLNCVAELRKLKETARFFVYLKPSAQREWAEEAQGRIRLPGADAPAVCILDTGVIREHPLLANSFDAADLHSNNPAWDTADTHGHGTLMAGLAIHGDLTELLASTGTVDIVHCGECVKVLNRDGDNEGELHGDLCREAIARAELAAPDRRRTVCMALTLIHDRNRGRPSSWSSTLDALASGAEDETRRLIVICAGNADPAHYARYPTSNAIDSIHDPGQSWNALTVGGVTFKTEIDHTVSPAATPLAPNGELSPYSCTSSVWQDGWPLKPDIVMEAGNLATDPYLPPNDVPELQLLSTHYRPHQRLFDVAAETSAATALAARLGARIQAHYPWLWPETVRGLMVHSADWTAGMLDRFRPQHSRENAKELLRHCGHGVPSESVALWSASNALTLIAEAEITPFEAARDGTGKITHMRGREMNLHALPWPIEQLEELGVQDVEMRVTLSYFIEPNPSARAWTKRYLYESHGLRFEVKRPHENDEDFLKRVNLKAREEEDARRSYASQDEGWLLGPRLRHLGSVHSDRWRGRAVDLAARGKIVVYPTMGWWRESRLHERWESTARYALIVSIATPSTDVELYETIETQINVAAGIEVGIDLSSELGEEP